MQRYPGTVTVFGGTGFIGRYVVRDLARANFVVKVVTRTPESAYFLKPCGHVGQVVPVACDYSDEKAVAETVKGSRFVVNLVGILHARKKAAFDRVHTKLPETIAKACKKHGIERFVHISALGADKASSRYARSKLAGEQAVQKAFPKTTILRPSVVFGAEDRFFNMFASLARFTPVLPLIGGGKTRFQPVYVGDVAAAVVAALTMPEGEKGPCGKIYELGGPDITDFKGIYKKLFQYTGHPRCLVALPWPVAKIQASFMGVIPNPPLTRDQVETLKADNVVDQNALKLADLGIKATSMDSILPEYLVHYRTGGRFSDKRRA